MLEPRFGYKYLWIIMWTGYRQHTAWLFLHISYVQYGCYNYFEMTIVDWKHSICSFRIVFEFIEGDYLQMHVLVRICMWRLSAFTLSSHGDEKKFKTQFLNSTAGHASRHQHLSAFLCPFKNRLQPVWPIFHILSPFIVHLTPQKRFDLRRANLPSVSRSADIMDLRLTGTGCEK